MQVQQISAGYRNLGVDVQRLAMGELIEAHKLPKTPAPRPKRGMSGTIAYLDFTECSLRSIPSRDNIDEQIQNWQQKPVLTVLGCRTEQPYLLQGNMIKLKQIVEKIAEDKGCYAIIMHTQLTDASRKLNAKLGYQAFQNKEHMIKFL